MSDLTHDKQSRLMGFRRRGLSYAVLWIFCLACIAITFGFNLWSLDKAYISADEGWYMYLFQRKVVLTESHGHLLFGAFPALNDIYINRLTAFALRVGAALLFGFGFNSYLRRRVGVHSSVIVLLGLMAMAEMFIVACQTIHYNQLLHVAIPAALGVTFYAFSYGRRWLYVLGGFIIGFILPIKATSLVLVPMALLAVYIICGRRNLLYYVLGGLLSVAFLVLVIETPQQVYQWLVYSVDILLTPRIEAYSTGGLVHWLIDMCKCFVKWALMVFVIVSYRQCLWSQRLSGVRGWMRHAAFGAGAVALFLYLWIFTYPYPYHADAWLPMALRNLTWVVVLLACVYSWRFVKADGYWVVMLLLLSTPVCYSFGTNISFLVHHSMAYAIVLLMPAFGFRDGYGVWFRGAAIMLIVLSACVFFDFPLRNWHGDRYAEQTVPLSAIGIDQQIKVDSAYIERIKYYRQNIPEGATVIPDRESWAVVHLLNLKTLSDAFYQTDSSYVDRLIAEPIARGDTVYVLLEGEYKVLTHR